MWNVGEIICSIKFMEQKYKLYALSSTASYVFQKKCLTNTSGITLKSLMCIEKYVPMNLFIKINNTDGVHHQAAPMPRTIPTLVQRKSNVGVIFGIDLPVVKKRIGLVLARSSETGRLKIPPRVRM